MPHLDFIVVSVSRGALALLSNVRLG